MFQPSLPSSTEDPGLGRLQPPIGRGNKGMKIKTVGEREASRSACTHAVGIALVVDTQAQILMDLHPNLNPDTNAIFISPDLSSQREEE